MTTAPATGSVRTAAATGTRTDRPAARSSTAAHVQTRTQVNTGTDPRAGDRPGVQDGVRADAPASSPRPTVGLPSVHLRTLLTWLAVYPCITIAQILLGPTLMPLSIPLRVLVITGLVVPLVVYVLVPFELRVRAALLRRRQR